METLLVFQFQGEESACHLSKIERSKLYGYVEKEVIDEDEQKCSLATLAADGQTLIGSGGTTFAYMNPDGLWCDKSELQAVDMENTPITSSPSSFKAPVELSQKASL
ncbi:MAG: hypothetical protein ACI8T1_003043 [Verrucomicrobiales bacterium]|jgi:hypothetical protein